MTIGIARPVFRRTLILLIALLIAFSIAEKARLYAAFSVKYTDEDQSMIWLSADELLKGHIHEPCFFGQAYNSCLEGWLAAPLVACGLELYEAVPLATIFMSTLPFMLLALYHARKQEYLTSIMVLVCLLGFSLEYKLVSILPRGFITGVFCFGIGYWILLKERKHHFFWFALFAFFGMAFNEMSFFLVFPVLLTLWLRNLKNRRFYLQNLLALAFAGGYKLYAWLFYNVLHPGYNYFRKPPLHWSFANFMKVLDCVDDWLFGNFTLVALCVLAAVAALLIKKKFQGALVILATMLLVFLSFGLSRMQEGSGWIFFSYSRLYVFIPLLVAVFYSFFRPLAGIPLNLQAFAGIPVFAALACHTWLQQGALEPKIAQAMAVSERPVKDVLRQSYEYIAICKATGNTVLAVDCPFYEEFILYTTIPLLSNNSIRTFMPEFDRRSWVFLPLLDEQPEKILVIGNIYDRFDRPALQHYSRRMVRQNPDGLVEYRLTKNMKRTFEEDFKIPLRRH